MQDDGALLCAGDSSSSSSSALSMAAETAWVMKRDWTDHGFQDGAEANSAKLQEFEDILVARLRASCARVLGTQVDSERGSPQDHENFGGANVLARALPSVAACSGEPPERVRAAVLRDPEVLGTALDMVGAYLKNYEVDKAAAVVDTVLPVCRERGGLWLLKALNHWSTVRMKQARLEEALVALKEIEAHSSVHKDDDEAWEFWETVYRNFGWVYSGMGQHDKAISYIQRSVDIKERVGRPASWFDLWDIGRMKAAAALTSNEADEIKASQAIITKALWRHRDEETSDLVMRAKIWHSVGECSFALGHLAEKRGGSGPAQDLNSKATSSEAQAHYKKALKCLKESHKLFKTTEGKHNPLTGQEAQAVSWTLMKLGEAEDAKPFLLDAVEALSRQQNGWGRSADLDAVSESDVSDCSNKASALLSAMQTVDRILEAHRITDDRDGLVRYFEAVERLCMNISARLQLEKDTNIDSAVYEKLISSCSMVMVASGTDEGTAKGEKLMRKFLWDSPNTEQAKICTQMLRALPGAGGGAFATLTPAAYKASKRLA